MLKNRFHVPLLSLLFITANPLVAGNDQQCETIYLVEYEADTATGEVIWSEWTVIGTSCTPATGSDTDPNPYPSTRYELRYVGSETVPGLRVLGSLGTNAGGVKLSFQYSDQRSVKATYELSANFSGFGVSLSAEYGTTKTWTLSGEYTTPRDGYWVFNAEEERINDYYDIVKITDWIVNTTEETVSPHQIAQKQNRLYYNIYLNGNRF